MKKTFLFFVAVLCWGTLKSQDAIPFLDRCLGYPVLAKKYINYSDELVTEIIPIDSLNNITLEFCPNGMVTIDHPQFIQPSRTFVYGLAVMTDSFNMPPQVTISVVTFNERTGFSVIDSIKGGNNHFCKHFFYDFRADSVNCIGEASPPLSPCHIYLFDQAIDVPDTFYIVKKMRQPYIYYPINEMHYNIMSHYCFMHLCETTGNMPVVACRGELDGVFPVLQLPCPLPRIPDIGPNYSGHARISWYPGDTSLYQLAFYSYDNDSLLFETDTLTETSYTVTDTTTPVPLQEGWYNVRLRKGCDYMDSPYHTVVWSEWSEPKRFYYIPRPEPGGIATPTIEPPFFTLSPNPAVHDVTLSFEEPLPEGSVLELYGSGGRRIEIFSILQGTVKQTIDTQKYPSGLYLLHLSTPTSATSRKLSVIH